MKKFFFPSIVALLSACCVTPLYTSAQLYGGLAGSFAHRSESLLQGKAINPDKMQNTLNLQFNGGYVLNIESGDYYTPIVSELSVTLYPDNVNGLNVQAQFGTIIPIRQLKLMILAGPSYNMAWTYGQHLTLAKTIRLYLPNEDGAQPYLQVSSNNKITSIGIGLNIFQE